MSHTTKLKSVIIRDTSALVQAVNDLRAQGVDCELRQNEKPRMYYANQHSECDYVLRLNKSPYDVGFERQDDGTYVPVFDEWAGNISNEIGANAHAPAGATCPMPNTAEGKAQHQIGQFFQQYAKHAAINAATAQGYMVESATTDEKGEINLILSGM